VGTKRRNLFGGKSESAKGKRRRGHKAGLRGPGPQSSEKKNGRWSPKEELLGKEFSGKQKKGLPILNLVKIQGENQESVPYYP